MTNITLDNQYSAAALYDGGWRAEDREELKAEYELTDEEVDEICEGLAEIRATKVMNQYGKEIDRDAAVALMDQDIMEQIDGMADTEQEYFELYCKKHLEKYGEEFEANKENPVW